MLITFGVLVNSLCPYKFIMIFYGIKKAPPVGEGLVIYKK